MSENLRLQVSHKNLRLQISHNTRLHHFVLGNLSLGLKSQKITSSLIAFLPAQVVLLNQSTFHLKRMRIQAPGQNLHLFYVFCISRIKMMQVSYGSDGKTSISEASICKHVEAVGSRENHRLSHHEMSGTFSKHCVPFLFFLSLCYFYFITIIF